MPLPEPGGCLSLWPTEECQWSTWDVWQSSDIIQHASYLCLALMLAYTTFVVIRFLLRYGSNRRELRGLGQESGADYIRNRTLVSDLSKGLGTLKAIPSSATFLGLAGTSYGILVALWFSYSGSPERYIALLFTRIAFAFATTLAGIIVATPAAVCHNLFRTSIENLSAPSSLRPPTGAMRSFRFAQTLPLKGKRSGLPPFAPIAAPVLACIVTLFMPFHPYRVPMGLNVLLPFCPSQPDVHERVIVLRVTKSDELFINTEPVSWTDLPRRLSAIYSTRASRELLLNVEDDVPFQTVADAIDVVRNSRAEGANSLDITVKLITPQAEAESEACVAASLERFRRNAPKKPH